MKFFLTAVKSPGTTQRRHGSVLQVRMVGYPYVVHDGQIPEESDVLEGPGDPEAIDPVRLDPHEVFPLEFHGAGIGPVDPGHEIEYRGLP